MISVSQDFQDQLDAGNRDYQLKVDITFLDSTSMLSLSKNDLFEFSIEDAISEDSKFTALGGAVINKATIVLNNSEELYTNFIFRGATVHLQLGLILEDESTEYIDEGYYTVDSSTIRNNRLELICLDYMAKFDVSYLDSQITYPATIQTIITDACTQCGVTLSGTVPNSSYELLTRPDVATFREVISAIAQITGTFAHINRQGQLYFGWFDVTSLESAYNNGTIVENVSNVAYITDIMSITPAQTDIIIGGVRCYIVNQETNETFEISYKDESIESDFCIDITNNPFIDGGNARDIVDYVGASICGLTIRGVNSSHLSNPLYEAGDVGVMLYKVINQEYIYCPFVFTRTTFSVNKLQETVCGIETLLENQSDRCTDAIKLSNELQIQTNQLSEQVEEAEKVALNYLSSDTSGIMVADLADGSQTPQSATGRNVKIDTDSVDIRNGQDVLASFGATTIIGDVNGVHVEISDSKLSFMTDSNTEVAYAKIEAETGESVFYMTKAIIVQDLYFGSWQWKSRDNGNLALKWIGNVES